MSTIFKNRQFGPNILLTETCNQNCAYCFAQKQMKGSPNKEMAYKDVEKMADFMTKNGLEKVRLMGGEPTIHSRFKEIIELFLARGMTIYLFTNGIFEKDIAEWLEAKGSKINYNINLSTPAFLSKATRDKIAENIKILKEKSELVASFNLSGFEVNESFLSFVKEQEIRSVKLGIANDLIGDLGWLTSDNFRKIGTTIIKLIERLLKTGVPEINFGCGLVPCMFSPEQIEFLKKSRVSILGWGCQGKAGSFDVSSDLSLFPCFILEKFKADNLFNFKTFRAAGIFFDRLWFFTAENLFTFAECKNCDKFKEFQCQGPCGGLVINEEKKQNEFTGLFGSLYYKIVYRLLFLFRNLL